MISDTQSTGAIFSPCRKFRYALWRRWGCQDPTHWVMFIGLNPSTADETNDDTTLRRCSRFTQEWGYDGVYLLNAYAFRATDPSLLKNCPDPVGSQNDQALSFYSQQADLIIAAWGNHCQPLRGQAICNHIGLDLYCLGRTQQGYPKHPLYLRADTKRELFWSPNASLR